MIFADDTTLLVSADNWEEALRLAWEEISKIHYWLKENYLKINISKTCYLPFSADAAGQIDTSMIVKSHNYTNNLESCIKNEWKTCGKLEKVSHAKYLVVFVNQYLRWDVHTLNMLTKDLGCLPTFIRK